MDVEFSPGELAERTVCRLGVGKVSEAEKFLDGVPSCESLTEWPRRRLGWLIFFMMRERNMMAWRGRVK